MSLLHAHFTLPTLPCSFPAKLHPDYESVRTECDPWILGLAHPNVRQVLRDSLLPRYACRLFPLAPDLPRLNVVTKFVTWLFLADDVVDAGPLVLPVYEGSHHSYMGSSSTTDQRRRRANPVSPPSWSDCVVSKLRYPGNDPPLPAAGLHPSQILLSALGELWTDISSHITPRRRAHFITTMEAHFKASKLHESLNSTFMPRQMPCDPVHATSIAEYMALRRDSSGFLVGVELLHYALGLDEDVIHLHPLMEELRGLAIDYMCMCNDLVSCHLETSAGAYFNLPYIVYNNGSVTSIEDAVETVVDMMARVDARSVLVVKIIQRDHADMMEREPKLKAYLESIVSFMSGTLCWSYETIRYGHRDTEANRLNASTSH